MSEKQIMQKIESAVPSAAKMLKSAMPKRLNKLSEVSKSHGRAIRRYKKRGLYCLSHEFRERVAADNASDEALRLSVQNSFVRRLVAATDLDLSADLIEIAAQMSLDVIQRTFEHQGLEFAAFLEDSTQAKTIRPIADYLDECLGESSIKASQRSLIKEAVLHNLAVSELAERLKEYKKQEKLAENDALMALSVYGRRRKRKETSKISEFGYRTWWLTGESRILHYTEDLELKEHAKYIMRPDFLINFLALAPSAKEVRDAYRSIFPSILGIRLARRIKPEELAKVLDHLTEAEGLEPGRREAKIAQLSDQLKSEMYGIAKTHF